MGTRRQEKDVMRGAVSLSISANRIKNEAQVHVGRIIALDMVDRVRTETNITC